MSGGTSPLPPWSYYKGDVDGEAVHEISDAEGGAVGYAYNEADARRIVTAVNHHDELVAALESLGAARDLLARIAKERGE